ncbi:MAG: hypothetical protein ACTTH0_06020, partial [Eubacteriales bacterium]
MSKKLITVLISLTILLFSGVCVYGNHEVEGTFFYRDLSLNGVKVSNYNLKSPIFIYNNATYVPLGREFAI